MKFIVYQTTNKVNGKLYIGVHKTKNPDIFDGYIGNGICVGYTLKNPKTVYQHALKKYGYKNFIRTTLKVYDTPKEAYEYEASVVTAEFVKQDNNYNTAVGGGGGCVIYKTIYQFNNQRELVNTWEGNYSIAEYYGVSLNTIQYALLERKIFKDSFLSYSQNPNFEEFTNYKNYDLYQYTLQGELVETFCSTRDCSEKLNLSFKSLETAVTEKKKYKNYYWTHHPEQIYEIIKINKLYSLANYSIVQYDLNNNIIQEYNSITEASKLLGYKYRDIQNAVYKELLLDGKFYFKSTKIIERSTKIAQYDLQTGELIKIWDSIAQCAKVHPKAREVVKGQRKQTHGYTFEYIIED